MTLSNILFIGMDVHKESIVISLADDDRTEVGRYGTIGSTLDDVKKTLRKLVSSGKSLFFCYEAGPCGYGLHRYITSEGHQCIVVAPSLIPKKPGDKVKTDKRDADNLTRLLRSGDLTRFENPKQLMCFLGLTPSEHSSGEKKKKGAITKTGNQHARRVLVEAGWAYRFSAKVSKEMQKRQENVPLKVRDIAWKAQLRLTKRFRKMSLNGKPNNLIVVAMAREIAAFMWSIANEIPITNKDT